jgi:uncharacterized protein (TIGR03546 family)
LTILLQQLFGLIKLLNSETGTNQIAWGVAAGFVLGMSPAFSLQTIIIFLLILLFRIQAGAAFVSAFFFTFIAFLLDPLSAALGSWILELPSMQSFYTSMYNLPIVPLTRFNNSIVMGSGALAIVLMPLVYLGAKMLVIKYRATIVQRYKDTAFWKALEATKIYKWYLRYEELKN